MCNEQVADTFLSGLEGAAQSCINSLPSLNGAPEATAITDQLNKCCPVIKKVRAMYCLKSCIELYDTEVHNCCLYFDDLHRKLPI